MSINQYKFIKFIWIIYISVSVAVILIYSISSNQNNLSGEKVSEIRFSPSFEKTLFEKIKTYPESDTIFSLHGSNKYISFFCFYDSIQSYDAATVFSVSDVDQKKFSSGPVVELRIKRNSDWPEHAKGYVKGSLVIDISNLDIYSFVAIYH